MASKAKQNKSRSRKSKGVQPPAWSERWKTPWNVLWISLAFLGEIVLIFLARSDNITIPAVQLVVLIICIPIVAHMVISGLRKLLFLASANDNDKK